MSYENILFEKKDSVAVITLNRPERMNAWNAIMASEISASLKAANDDDEVRAIVITGAGKAFCAGADLQKGGDTFAGRSDTGARPGETDSAYHPYHVNKPVIAAMNGSAVGVGMTYPLLCDIRLVAEDAKLGFVFTRRGMLPELASHLLLQRVTNFSQAADLLLSGRIFSGAEAADLGVVSKALPKEKVLPAAMEIASDFVNTAPASVAITKRLLWEGLDSNMKTMLKREGPLFAWTGNQLDAKEGVMSFIEKRQPNWKLSASTDLPDFL